MKRTINLYLFFLLLLSGVGVQAQDSLSISPPKRLTSDMIAFIWGDTVRVNIRKVDKEYVTYSLEGERYRQKTQKTNITSLFYKDGRVEKYPNQVFKRKLSEGASKIKVTNSDEDVQIYREIAEVEGRYVGYESFTYTNSFLERMAIDNLKEIAFKNDPAVRVLLIKKVSITRGYGEGPSAVVTAVAYTR
ncbi:hypothetical protein [Alistipes sp. ZOR0009]|uniref:hypothetical protein n=1 Tax=Alistipes sp. ZOR0009 TaxID=1339253 RepID=UPI000648609C|nr:hypothetical protein [Alistipes sp. ZOR0009]